MGLLAPMERLEVEWAKSAHSVAPRRHQGQEKAATQIVEWLTNQGNQWVTPWINQ